MSDPAHSLPSWSGSIEPHALLLKQPPDDQLLYKVMKAADFVRSVSGRYLHFNRVDSYKDFRTADAHDGEQLPADLPANMAAQFTASPDFTAADYYNQSRARTYACCFSLENSKYIWHNYGTGGTKGKVCVVFEFGKLRAQLNNTLENAGLMCKDIPCHQIFSINYGLVEYVDWAKHRSNGARFANPIQYTYLKDASTYRDDRELRVSLSALGIGHFSLNDGSNIEFQNSLQVEFDFRAAIATEVIQQLIPSPDCDLAFVQQALDKCGIGVRSKP
jgi:hypothetical protein